MPKLKANKITFTALEIDIRAAVKGEFLDLYLFEERNSIKKS